MSVLRLYDTLSRDLLPVYAADGQRLRCYVCGPTVYGPAHIGNFRTFLFFDVLYRVARLAGLHPCYVRNLTDVDDKTIRGAHAAGESLRTFTGRWTAKFHRDCAALNLLPPDLEPAATGHIPEQIALVEKLLAGGHAYVAPDGSVYYRVASFARYGCLSHFDPAALRSPDATSAGETNLADEYDRDHVADFALWKARKEEDGEVFWPSPWGPGRPGWHLECSAMSMRYLGPTFDLHGGGEDLCFPHHENEIAQSEAATGLPFARHWVHSVHLLVDGKKMSKSLGNFFTLDDLLARGTSPQAVRLALLSGHYRKQLNFTLHSLEAAAGALEKLFRAAGPLDPPAPSGPAPAALGVLAPAWEALLEDLNVPAALGATFAALRAYDPVNPADRAGLATLLAALGLRLEAPAPASSSSSIPADIAALADRRWQARSARDFAAADTLRRELAALGWEVKDRKDGYDLSPAPLPR